MNDKKNPNDDENTSKDAGKDSGWQKTISDSPVPDIDNISKGSSQSEATDRDKMIGEILGSGKVVQFLGEGGMARVYKIWNEALEMHRSVKILLPSEKKEVSKRFITEARITAHLNHPNIVSVLNFGEWKGNPIIEMEYIDGLSLDKILQSRGSFPACFSCAIGVLVSRALCYAHVQEFVLYGKPYKGVIHRDLKPGNIMIEHNGKLKLMDFGIARPISTGLHTMDGNIVGTLPYLAPEQINNENVDQRTDIYAVGAILYELLCGSKAFPDERLTELVNKKEKGIYTKFGDIPITVPPKLAEIVDTCLKVDQKDRYQDADALAEAFRIAYDRCTSERPETVLKKYLEDSGYTPLLPVLLVKEKKKKSLPRLPEFHLPKVPNLRLPKVQLPKVRLPKLTIPQIRLPKIKVPHIRLPQLPSASRIARLMHFPWKRRSIVIFGSSVTIVLLALVAIFVVPDRSSAVIRTVQTWFTPPEPVQKEVLSVPSTPVDTQIKHKDSVVTLIATGIDSVLNIDSTAIASVIDSVPVIKPDTIKVSLPSTDSTFDRSSDTLKPVPQVIATDSTTISTGNYPEIREALRSGNVAKAFDVLLLLPDKDPKKLELQFQFTEKCIEVKDLENAHRFITKIKSEDARVYLLRGRLLYAKNRLEQALEEYANAMISSTASKDAQKIKSEILFYQAECHEMIYRRTPNIQNLQKAIKIWTKVLQNEFLREKHYFAKHRLQNLKSLQTTVHDSASLKK